MIRGHIDFSQLDRSATLLHETLTQGRPLNLPGLNLQVSGSAVQVFGNGKSLLLLSGTPRTRDARMAQSIRNEGWGCLLPWLLAQPNDILAQLAGRFSLLWIDIASGRIGMASDRLNTYGFCYASEGSRLSFADRADEVPRTQREINPQAIFDYLYFHMIPAPGSIFVGVQRLCPGSVVVADSKGVKESIWWTPKFREPKDGYLPDLAESFRGLIREAVQRELGDKPVGAFLSGGTDSSTVVGMLSRCTDAPVQAYSIGFDSEGYDEMEYARIAAKAYGAEHHEYYITPEDLVAGIPSVAAHYDQPFGNSSSLPAFYCARLAQQDGLGKLLAGDGGDELFGGNTRYAKQRVFGYYDHVPGALRSLVTPLMQTGLARSLPLVRKASSYVAQANTPLPDRGAEYNLLNRLGIENVFQPGFLNRIATDAPIQLQREVWNQAEANSTLNRMLAFDWRFTLADNDLPKVIGTTALAGMDVAFPLLDDDLIDFSMNLPPSFKLRGLKLRWFFKEALKGFLPPEIITKQKHGFGLPFGPWTLHHDGLNKQAREALSSLATRGIVREDFLVALIDSRLAEHPGYYGEMVWICQTLEHWLRAHAPDFRIE